VTAKGKADRKERTVSDRSIWAKARRTKGRKGGRKEGGEGRKEGKEERIDCVKSMKRGKLRKKLVGSSAAASERIGTAT